MANIFQGESKVAQCVREWDRQLRLSEWVDTDVFVEVFDLQNISYEEGEGYRKAIKKAKNLIREALAEQGISLRERHSEIDSRKILTAYPEHNSDPLHNERILAVIENAIDYRRALKLTYSPSFREAEEHIFHPQYRRIYNGRHYVYGVYECDEENKGLPFVALPIDRIVAVNTTREVAYRPGDANEYEQQMRNVLGASPNFQHPEVIDVVLRTHNPKVHKLLLTKPLHHTIREIKPCTAEHPGELTLHVQRSIELNNWILHYGAWVDVVAPADLREHIATIVSRMNKIYND
jgi:predicted DNA-binding transcriptional regulator YafY